MFAPIAPRPPSEPGADAPHAGQVALRWAVLALVAGAVITIAPLWMPLVLASWSAILARPLQRRLARLVGGRTRAAGVVTVVLVLAVLTPVVLTLLSLAASAVDLVTRLSTTEDGAQALGALFATESTPKPLDTGDTRQMIELLRQHGASALTAVRTLFGAAASVAVGLFVFVFAFYTFLVDGRRAYDWMLDHSPLAATHLNRLSAAFEETGRGLFISLGGTALIQGGLATIGYLVIGTPQALLLGLLTALGSFIPIVGTGLVWGPLTLAMLVMGRSGQAIAVLVLGLIVSGLDNFVRPWLSRYGALQLPTFVIFVAMLGGVAAFGPSGPLFGPLLVRLAVEAVQIWRNEPHTGA